MRHLLAPVIAVAALTLGGCGGTPEVDEERLAEAVSSQLGETVGREPESVDCPEPLVGEVGETTRCTLTDSGQTYGVEVTTTEVDGSEVRFDIEVDETPQ